MNAYFLIILICLHFADKASCCGVPDVQFPIKKPDEPGNREARRKPNSRIRGGEEANPHSLPWQVYLYSDKILPWGKKQSYLCGGSIISPYWIVTATHCIKDRIVSQVVAGAHIQIDEDSANRQVRKNAIIIEHPGYNASTFNNDIALLRLDQPFEFNSYVQPVCVNDQDPSENSICFTSGWGITETGKVSAVLEQLYVDMVDSSECFATYGFHNPETKLCAWDKDKSDKTTCQGDSGGPLICKSNTETEWSLIGVTSYGGSCELKIPMVFTKVSKYINWIREHMKTGEVSNRRYEGELSEIEGQEYEGIEVQKHEGMEGQDHEGIEVQKHGGIEGKEREGMEGQEYKGMEGQEHDGLEGNVTEGMVGQALKGMEDQEQRGIEGQDQEREEKNVKEWKGNEPGRMEGQVQTNEASLPSADMAIENKQLRVLCLFFWLLRWLQMW